MSLLHRLARAALRALDFVGVRLIDSDVVRVDECVFVVADGNAAREARVASEVLVEFVVDGDDATEAYCAGAGVFPMPAPKGLPS